MDIPSDALIVGEDSFPCGTKVSLLASFKVQLIFYYSTVQKFSFALRKVVLKHPRTGSG